jgi:hypothetical protein
MKISVYMALIGMLVAVLTTECGAAGPGSERVLGMWEGTTIARCPGSRPGRCNAQQKISITLQESNNSKIAGSYTCAYGNQTCLRQNNTGTVAAVRLADSRITFRVFMPDGTSCIYNGNVANNAISGGYSCYGGGGLLEQGSWTAHRASE